MKISFYAIIWVTAIILAISSAFYSVFGLSKLFSGAVIAIIIVASILESSKIVLATYIHDYWDKSSKVLKAYMVFALLCLMIITSLGVYGFLTSAYQDTIKDFKLNQSEISKIEMKIESFNNQLKLIRENETRTQAQLQNLQKIKANQDVTLSNVYSSDKSKNTRLLEKSITSTNSLFEKSSSELLNIQNKASTILDSINIYETKKLELQTTNQISEIGPLLYISKALSVEMDTVVNLLVFLIMIVFDPLAVALVFAANSIKIKDKNSFDKYEKNVILSETSEETTQNEFEDGVNEIEDNTYDKLDETYIDSMIENNENIDVETLDAIGIEQDNIIEQTHTVSDDTFEKKNEIIDEQTKMQIEINKEVNTADKQTVKNSKTDIYGDPEPKVKYSRMVKIQ